MNSTDKSLKCDTVNYGGESCAGGDNCGHCDHDKGESVKTGFIRAGISVCFFALGLAFSGSAVADSPLIELLIMLSFLASYCSAGGETVFNAIRGLFKGKLFDENFLMTVATAGAIALGDYPEAASVMILYRLGETLSDLAVRRSERSVAHLMELRPQFANVERAGLILRIAPRDILIGETIVINPGERVPLDCVVISGESDIDTSALTGEPMMRYAGKGIELISGCVNGEGLLKARVLKLYADSTIEKILALVESAGSKKAHTERFITRFSRVYTPAVVAAAILIAFVPLLFGAEFAQWAHRALVFLVISCPCALVISVPLTYFAGVGGAAKKGILIKGTTYIELLAKASVCVFDKTGTLTNGEFTVSEVYPSGVTEQRLFELLTLVEAHSNHPIARSITAHIGKSPDLSRIGEYRIIPGRGAYAVIDGKPCYAGNLDLMKECGANPRDSEVRRVSSGGSAVYASYDGKYIGCCIISDSLKPDSVRAVRELKREGVSMTAMLTGDSKDEGERIGRLMEFDRVYSRLLPDQKVEKLEALISENENGSLIYVGDGINDAPVLARADVGMAMGALGSDAAIESADVVITDDNPLKVPLAVRLSKKTTSIVMQNIIFALSVKAVFIVLGAFGIAGMWSAVFADVGVTLIAVLNAARAARI